MAPTVTISARGEQRLRAGHPWIYRSDVADVTRRRRRIVAVRSAARPRRWARRFYSDRSQIALRMLTLRRRRRRRGAVRRRDRSGGRVPRVARDRRDRVPAGARRGRPAAVARSSIGTATISSCRRCRRAWIGCCRPSSRRSTSGCSPRGILARNDPRTRSLEGLEQQVEVLAGEVPELGRRSREAAIDTRSICAAGRRPDCSSTSARTARRRRNTRTAVCSTASATTAGSR